MGWGDPRLGGTAKTPSPAQEARHRVTPPSARKASKRMGVGWGFGGQSQCQSQTPASAGLPLTPPGPLNPRPHHTRPSGRSQTPAFTLAASQPLVQGYLGGGLNTPE